MPRGNIEKRGNGYRIRVSDGFDPLTGKRRLIYRSVAGSKAAAESELTKLLREIDTGHFADPGQVTVSEYLDQWLAHVKTSGIRPRTFERYDALLRQHVMPTLGPIKLARLKPLHIQGLYTRALASGRRDGRGGLSARTVVHIHRVLSQALHQAVRWQILSINPATAIDPPSPEPPDLETVDQQMALRILMASRGTRLEVPITLALGAGLRRGEALGIRWADIDLVAGTVNIRQTLQVDGSFTDPKTGRSRRTVTLPGFEGMRNLTRTTRPAVTA